MRSSLALLLAVVLAGCSSPPADVAGPREVSSGGGDAMPAAPAETDVPAGPASPAVDGPTAAGAPQEGAATPTGSATAAPAPPPPTDGGAAEDDGEAPPPGDDTGAPAPRPVEPGTYTYATDGSMTITGGTPRRLPDRTTFRAEAPADGRQHTARDLRDDDGRGQVTETTLLYTDAGVLLSFVKVTSDLGGGLRSVREWRVDPPGLLAPAGAEPGERNQFTMRGGDTTARVTVELLRREDVEVAGQRVETMVTRIDIVVTGAVEGEQTTTAWVRPSDFLTIKEDVDSHFSSGAIAIEMSYRAELVGLDPS